MSSWVTERVPTALVHEEFKIAGRIITDYSALFALKYEKDGSDVASGVFVNTHGLSGILTANHVAKDITELCDAVLCVEEDAHHPLSIPPSSVEHVPIGQLPTGSVTDGPDLSLLIIRDRTLLTELKRTKSFFDLDADPSWPTGFLPGSMLPPALSGKVFWAIAGTPRDCFKPEESYDGPSRLEKFVGSGDFPFSHLQVAEFDYINIDVTAGVAGFPDDYNGVSGGGFWIIPMEIDGVGKVSHLPPILAGIQFAQNAAMESGRVFPDGRRERVRQLKGHGPNSLYIRLPQILAERLAAVGNDNKG